MQNYCPSHFTVWMVCFFSCKSNFIPLKLDIHKLRYCHLSEPINFLLGPRTVGQGWFKVCQKSKLVNMEFPICFIGFRKKTPWKMFIQSIIKFSIGFISVVQAWEQSKSAVILWKHVKARILKNKSVFFLKRKLSTWHWTHYTPIVRQIKLHNEQ